MPILYCIGTGLLVILFFGWLISVECSGSSCDGYYD